MTRWPVPMRLVALMLGGLSGLLWYAVETPAVQVRLHEVVLFILALAITERLPIRHVQGQTVPTSLAILGAVAILGFSPLLLAATAVLGWLIALAIDRGRRPPAALIDRTVTAWALAGVAALGNLMQWTWIGTAVDASQQVAIIDVGAALSVGLAIVLGIALAATLQHAVAFRAAWLRRFTEQLRATMLSSVAVVATAALGALVHDILGGWTVPTMLIPLLAARVGLDRYAGVQLAYDQTIRAMSRLPEQIHAVPADHGVRVGVLARDVAIELGMPEGLVVDVERAAHLHELGRIRHEPGDPLTPNELATAGASITRAAGDLDRVAAIIEAHGNLRARPQADPDVLQAARIVAASCGLDRYAPMSGDETQYEEVLVRLVREVGDLDVVGALARVRRRAVPA